MRQETKVEILTLSVLVLSYRKLSCAFYSLTEALLFPIAILEPLAANQTSFMISGDYW